MEQRQIDEIVECLPKGRTLFSYFKDRYALLLLSHFVGKGKKVHEIKKSRYRGLLDKAILKTTTQALSHGRLTPNILSSVSWPATHEAYRLTLGQWGASRYWNQSWYQTSRPGKNLVLQLNFSNKHNDPYYRLIKPKKRHPFEYRGHPIARKGMHTLAWTRLDLDMGSGDALIEEIQTDWIREVLWRKIWFEHKVRKDPALLSRSAFRQHPEAPQCDVRSFLKYEREVLRPHIGLWKEALLAATIWFLHKELGLRRIFMHTFESGLRLKGFHEDKPPRSLYSRLPRRFCFQETDEVPTFLLAQRRVRKEVRKDSLRLHLLEL